MTDLVSYLGFEGFVIGPSLKEAKDAVCSKAFTSSDPTDLVPEVHQEPPEEVDVTDLFLNGTPVHKVHGNTGKVNNPNGRGNSPGKRAGELKNWQMGIVDLLIEDPGIKRTEIATKLRVTPEWLSRVMNSDAFQKYLDERMQQHRILVSEKIVREAGAVALVGLEKMKQRITLQSDSVKMADLTKAVETTGKMMGLGGKGDGDKPIVNFFGVSPDLLKQARESMNVVSTINTTIVEEAEVVEQDNFFLTDGGDDDEKRMLDRITEIEGREDLDSSERLSSDEKYSRGEAD